MRSATRGEARRGGAFDHGQVEHRAFGEGQLMESFLERGRRLAGCSVADAQVRGWIGDLAQDGAFDPHEEGGCLGGQIFAVHDFREQPTQEHLGGKEQEVAQRGAADAAFQPRSEELEESPECTDALLGVGDLIVVKLGTRLAPGIGLALTLILEIAHEIGCGHEIETGE